MPILSADDYKYLMGLPKVFKDIDEFHLSANWTKTVVSTDGKNLFLFDYKQGNIEVKKYTYNKRYCTSVVLLRFDSQGIHTNPEPDGKTFIGPHVHLYTEEYGDKMAFPCTQIGVDENNLEKGTVFIKVLQFCNIDSTNITIQGGLFA